MTMSGFKTTVSRRVAIRTLAFLGASASLASRLIAQVRQQITPEALGQATAILDQEFTDERLEVIAPALQWNLHQFQLVRDLELDDLVEPAPTFRVNWR